jgi:hypothetical protein
MALPLSTTTISILRLPPTDLLAEPYDNPGVAERSVIASGIRAHLDINGSEITRGGEQTSYQARFYADPCDIDHLDWFRDDRNGYLYEVQTAVLYQALGLDHVEGTARRVVGATS